MGRDADAGMKQSLGTLGVRLLAYRRMGYE